VNLKIYPHFGCRPLFTYVLVCIMTFALFATPSWAQSTPSVKQETIDLALKIATKIERENLVLQSTALTDKQELERLRDQSQLIEMRLLASDAAFHRIGLSAIESAETYLNAAREFGSERDLKLAEILFLHAQLDGADFDDEKAGDQLNRIRSFKIDLDWFIAHRASIMEVNLLLSARNYDIALKNARAALALIPSEIDPQVLEAQYETYDLISFLQLVLLNVEQGTETTELVVSKGLEQGRKIDGISLINNLTYAFDNWREYETSERLAEILFNLSNKTTDSINSLVYYRYGRAQNSAGHYQDALNTLNIAHDNTDKQSLKMGIEMARAVAFAGTGRTAEADLSLAEFDRLYGEIGSKNTDFDEIRLRVLALIAVQNNDAKTAAKYLDQRLKSVVQVQLARQSKGVQSLQANLENDKQRQTEREAALLRETALKQSELEAKQRSNVFLMGLAGSLLFIAFAAIGFAVWRQKISKILQTAAHEAEAGDRAKSQFLSVMSHELRTPLNGIIGIAGILSEKGETQELRNYNKLILKSGQNLLELLSGILDMSQMESGKLNIVTAPSSIRQIVEGLYLAAMEEVDTSRIEMTCFVSDDIPDDLMLDGIRVKQALSNLLSNAVRFTEKGRIHIHITMGQPNRHGSRDLTLIVADTGRGIAEDVQAKLFKPFVQADSSLTRTHDGAGIGLAVTRGLARLMGGDVTMTSKAGRGSEFTMTLKTCAAHDARIDPETNRPVFDIEPSAEMKIDFAPAVSIEKLRANEAEKQRREFDNRAPDTASTNDELEDLSDVEFETISQASLETPVVEPEVLSDLGIEQSSAPESPRAVFTRRQPRSDDDLIAPDQLQGLNILIVEDVEANQEVLRSLLEPVGCTVNCAEHGQKALNMMDTQIFDAVIMDIRMPVMDGIETTKAIRALEGPHQNVAIIALTADASAENNAECLAAGADVFLTKPVVVSELFSSIRFARRKQYRQKQQSLSA